MLDLTDDVNRLALRHVDDVTIFEQHVDVLTAGDHELVAIFTGKGPQSREYRRGATMKFNKGIGAKYLELEITDRIKKQQPEFVIKEWE